ncbi:hypothetical protein KSP39_PZI010776 [Platanthera zijinensis]|uniref:Uncharacterized protein n=1 Tax=Platanthera zijinensis TaxID=2320716 RepID=A0AAP0BJ71_9ASPA
MLINPASFLRIEGTIPAALISHSLLRDILHGGCCLTKVLMMIKRAVFFSKLKQQCGGEARLARSEGEKILDCNLLAQRTHKVCDRNEHLLSLDDPPSPEKHPTETWPCGVNAARHCLQPPRHLDNHFTATNSSQPKVRSCPLFDAPKCASPPCQNSLATLPMLRLLAVPASTDLLQPNCSGVRRRQLRLSPAFGLRIKSSASS